MLAERSAPDPFLDTFTGLVAARAVTTAAMLGVFDALHEAPATAAQLAERLDLDPLGAETLLAALGALGYVEHEGELARNAEVSERLLVRSSPESIARTAASSATASVKRTMCSRWSCTEVNARSSS